VGSLIILVVNPCHMEPARTTLPSLMNLFTLGERYPFVCRRLPQRYTKSRLANQAKENLSKRGLAYRIQ
jgi:hypothetical protein